MNWTGGSLKRHPLKDSRRREGIQRQYFARTRANLMIDRPKHSPIRLFSSSSKDITSSSKKDKTSSRNSGEPRLDGLQEHLTAYQNHRNTPFRDVQLPNGFEHSPHSPQGSSKRVQESSSGLIDPQQVKKESDDEDIYNASPVPCKRKRKRSPANSAEQRKRLLQQSDWVGTRIQKPFRLKYPVNRELDILRQRQGIRTQNLRRDHHRNFQRRQRQCAPQNHFTRQLLRYEPMLESSRRQKSQVRVVIDGKTCSVGRTSSSAKPQHATQRLEGSSSSFSEMLFNQKDGQRIMIQSSGSENISLMPSTTSQSSLLVNQDNTNGNFTYVVHSTPSTILQPRPRPRFLPQFLARSPFEGERSPAASLGESKRVISSPSMDNELWRSQLDVEPSESSEYCEGNAQPYSHPRGRSFVGSNIANSVSSNTSSENSTGKNKERDDRLQQRMGDIEDGFHQEESSIDEAAYQAYEHEFLGRHDKSVETNHASEPDEAEATDLAVSSIVEKYQKLLRGLRETNDNVNRAWADLKVSSNDVVTSGENEIASDAAFGVSSISSRARSSSGGFHQYCQVPKRDAKSEIFGYETEEERSKPTQTYDILDISGNRDEPGYQQGGKRVASPCRPTAKVNLSQDRNEEWKRFVFNDSSEDEYGEFCVRELPTSLQRCSPQSEISLLVHPSIESDVSTQLSLPSTDSTHPIKHFNENSGDMAGHMSNRQGAFTSRRKDIGSSTYKASRRRPATQLKLKTTFAKPKPFEGFDLSSPDPLALGRVLHKDRRIGRQVKNKQGDDYNLPSIEIEDSDSIEDD
jgi:hypothetical protein